MIRLKEALTERRGEIGDLYGPDSCVVCRGNPFECGCLDVNFDSKGERKQTGETREGASEVEAHGMDGRSVSSVEGR